MILEIKNSGGKRPGAGRKRNKTPTRQISIRFPMSLIISAEMKSGKPFDLWLKQKAKEACYKDGSKAVKCPRCGKELKIRSGKFGEFICCSGYPKCPYKGSTKKNKNPLEQRADEILLNAGSNPERCV